jgi:hypothetical protein
MTNGAKRKTLNFREKSGGADETRTRDLRRDRPVVLKVRLLLHVTLVSQIRLNYAETMVLGLKRKTRVSRGKVARLAGIEPAAYGSGDWILIPHKCNRKIPTPY